MLRIATKTLGFFQEFYCKNSYTWDNQEQKVTSHYVCVSFNNHVVMTTRRSHCGKQQHSIVTMLITFTNICTQYKASSTAHGTHTKLRKIHLTTLGIRVDQHRYFAEQTRGFHRIEINDHLSKSSTDQPTAYSLNILDL